MKQFKWLSVIVMLYACSSEGPADVNDSGNDDPESAPEESGGNDPSDENNESNEPEPAGINFVLPQLTTLAGTDSRPSQIRPGLRQSVVGIHETLTTTRVTPSEDYGSHSYSKRQAWNANETLLFVGSKILDAESYLEVDSVSISSEKVWSRNKSHLMYGMKFAPKRTHFVEYNTNTKEERVLRRFEQYENCTLGDYEGSQSLDDKFIVFACRDNNDRKTLISYDIENDVVLGTLDAQSSFNWASVALSGESILVENNAPSDPNDGEILVYSRDFEFERRLTDSPHHGDISIDDEGNDVYVMINWNYISYFRINDGAQVNLGATNRAGNGHISCRAFSRPGWCYFSSRDQYQRIGAIRIGMKDGAAQSTDDNGDLAWEGVSLVELWGHSKSSSSTYQNQAKASVSPSGTKIIFSSNWSNNLNPHTPHPDAPEEAHEYVIEYQEPTP